MVNIAYYNDNEDGRKKNQDSAPDKRDERAPVHDHIAGALTQTTAMTRPGPGDDDDRVHNVDDDGRALTLTCVKVISLKSDIIRDHITHIIHTITRVCAYGFHLVRRSWRTHVANVRVHDMRSARSPGSTISNYT